MAQRSVIVRLKAEIGEYLSNMRKAGQAAEQVADKTEKSSQKASRGMGKLVSVARENEQAWASTSTALLGIGTAAVAGAGLAVKTFADFDKAMSSVQAATLASESDMNKLREAAVKAGAETAFSAEEAAAGIEELAKAGVSTEAILSGGLDGALSLAAAGALEVGDAAEIAASAMTQFKLDGDKVTNLADLLAAGAGKAQGSVQDLGAALNQSGLVAAQTGLTIEEATGGLAAFASAGLVGSDAGTSFKTMLQRLNPQSEAAATLMEELGLSAYDAEGEFVGLSEYAGQLKTALSGMSSEQRNATMQTLFGSDAVRAAAVLYEQGAEGVQQWEDAVNDAGYAAETAAAMQDNLAGDLEKLGGAMDTVFLQAGSGANDALRGLVQGVEGVVDAIGRIPAPVLTATAAVAGIGGAGMLAVGGVMKLIPAVADTVDGFNKLVPAGGKARGVLMGVGKAAGVAAGIGAVGIALAKVAENNYMQDIDTGMGRVARALDLVADSGPEAGAAMDELFQDRDGGDLIAGVEDMASAIDRTFNKSAVQKANDWAEGIINGFTGIEGSSQILEGSWDRIDQQLSDLVSSGNADAAGESFDYLAERMRAQGASMGEVRAMFPGYIDALAGAEAESGGAAAGAESVSTGMEGVAGASEEAAASLSDVVDAMSMLGMIELDAQAATGAFNEALRETATATEGMAGAVVTAAGAFDVTTEAGYAAQQAFAGVATSGWDMAEGVAAAGGSFGEISGSLQSTYDGLVTTAQGFGFTAEQAAVLASEALGIPDGVSIESWMSSSALDMAFATGGALAGLPEEETIRSWMSDAAFQEAVRTRAAALGIPESEAISSFMDSYARGEADSTTAAVLDIPEGASVASWMDANAENQAWRTKQAIDAIPKDVSVNITTYKRNVETWEKTSVGSGNLGSAGRNSVLAPGFASGGRAPSLASGGRLPSTGLGTDKILGVSSMTGAPTAWVDDREWVVNQRMSDKYDGLIGMVNRDDPKVRHLAGYASGGRPASREYTAAPAGFGVSAPSVTVPEIDYGRLAEAMSRVNLSAEAVVTPRTAKRIVGQAGINR